MATGKRGSDARGHGGVHKNRSGSVERPAKKNVAPARPPSTPPSVSSEHRPPRGGSSRSASCIAGKHAVIEALEAAVPIDRIVFQNGIQHTDAVVRIETLAATAGVKVVSLPKTVLDQQVDAVVHQGVIAEAAPFRYRPLGSLVKGTADESSALVIVLDHLTDSGNLGAIIRTAEVVGASGIVIPNRRSASVNLAVYKTSAGAVSRLPIAQVPNLVQALAALRSAGFWIVGASEKATDICWDTDLSGRIALVMGSEDVGLSRLMQESCDLLVKLPQRGSIGSLNVAQATTALAYEWLRRSWVGSAGE
jgi:23S rRNA (guanosine2251-2'-O)-methyltransferase